MPFAVLECTHMRFSDPGAIAMPDVRLPMSSVEPGRRYRAVPRLGRLSLPVRSPGQHVCPLLRRSRWVDSGCGGASGA